MTHSGEEGGLHALEPDKQHSARVYGCMIIIMICWICRLFSRGRQVMGEKEDKKKKLIPTNLSHISGITSPTEQGLGWP